MKIRFFGSPDCRGCLKIFVILEKSQVEYEYIDGNDERKVIQDFCDAQNIDVIPHLQFVDDDKNVIDEHIGSINEEEFKTYLIKYFPNYWKVIVFRLQ